MTNLLAIRPTPADQVAAMMLQTDGDAEAVLAQLCRRTFRLSDEATVEDINRHVKRLLELMAPAPTVTLSAARSPSPISEICRCLGIREADYWRYLN